MSDGISGGRRHVMNSTMGARVPIAKPEALGEETLPAFWNPGRIGMQLAPQHFRSTLHEIDPQLEACWNRDSERWQVFVRNPKVQSRICQGWQLLFIVKGPGGCYVPLDERTLAKVYSIQADRFGSGKRYFDAVVREMVREREESEKWERQDTHDSAGEYFDYTTPKVGYGAISSSKVVGQ